MLESAASNVVSLDTINLTIRPVLYAKGNEEVAPVVVAVLNFNFTEPTVPVSCTFQTRFNKALGPALVQFETHAKFLPLSPTNKNELLTARSLLLLALLAVPIILLFPIVNKLFSIITGED